MCTMHIHDGDCEYQESQPCGHLQEDNSYSCQEASPGEPGCNHTDGCGYAEGASCSHECNDNCVVDDDGAAEEPESGEATPSEAVPMSFAMARNAISYSSQVSVDGVPMYPSEEGGVAYYKNGFTSAPSGDESDYNAKYDRRTNTLTLNGFDLINGVATYPAIKAANGITVELEGQNTIRCSERNPHSFGINVEGDLTIGGGGSLRCTWIGAKGELSVIGNVSLSLANRNKNVMNALDDLLIDGAKITVTSHGGLSCLYAGNNIIIRNGADIYALCKGTNAYAINANGGTVTISGDATEVEAISGEKNAMIAHGGAQNAIVIYGGTVTAMSEVQGVDMTKAFGNIPVLSGYTNCEV